MAPSSQLVRVILKNLQEKRLNMKTDEKQSLDDDKYVTLDKIPTWKEQTMGFNMNERLNDKVSIFVGDITALVVDAIVNPTDGSMSGNGGVDRVIHIAAGKALDAECKTLGFLNIGEAKITHGYNLPAKYIIHTAGSRSSRNHLENCYMNSLTVALENGVRSIAFPCISTGNFGYPHKEAAHVALRTVRHFLEMNYSFVNRIVFCLFLPIDVDIYNDLIKTYFPV